MPVPLQRQKEMVNGFVNGKEMFGSSGVARTLVRTSTHMANAIALAVYLLIRTKSLNIESMTVFLNLIQESQELLSALRHEIRGKGKYVEG